MSSAVIECKEIKDSQSDGRLFRGLADVLQMEIVQWLPPIDASQLHRVSKAGGVLCERFFAALRHFAVPDLRQYGAAETLTLAVRHCVSLQTLECRGHSLHRRLAQQLHLARGPQLRIVRRNQRTLRRVTDLPFRVDALHELCECERLDSFEEAWTAVTLSSVEDDGYGAEASDEWGDRTSLTRARRKAMRTLIEWRAGSLTRLQLWMSGGFQGSIDGPALERVLRGTSLVQELQLRHPSAEQLKTLAACADSLPLLATLRLLFAPNGLVPMPQVVADTLKPFARALRCLELREYHENEVLSDLSDAAAAPCELPRLTELRLPGMHRVPPFLRAPRLQRLWVDCRPSALFYSGTDTAAGFTELRALSLSGQPSVTTFGLHSLAQRWPRLTTLTWIAPSRRGFSRALRWLLLALPELRELTCHRAACSVAALDKQLKELDTQLAKIDGAAAAGGDSKAELKAGGSVAASASKAAGKPRPRELPLESLKCEGGLASGALSGLSLPRLRTATVPCGGGTTRALLAAAPNLIALGLRCFDLREQAVRESLQAAASSRHGALCRLTLVMTLPHDDMDTEPGLASAFTAASYLQQFVEQLSELKLHESLPRLRTVAVESTDGVCHEYRIERDGRIEPPLPRKGGMALDWLTEEWLQRVHTGIRGPQEEAQ